eukprot:TRINITY_DN8218_c0_g1_i3.p1 TRINITY_DN8218_c0_g1~~TRINITY_DN8218_c0_g1_i3.p1  ORF type:complete len:699 (-),score=112.00 TRINITY_DN8218_c0_g1_i3:384-2480(-)
MSRSSRSRSGLSGSTKRATRRDGESHVSSSSQVETSSCEASACSDVLERSNTLTEYNELSENEWANPANMHMWQPSAMILDPESAAHESGLFFPSMASASCVSLCSGDSRHVFENEKKKLAKLRAELCEIEEIEKRFATGCEIIVSQQATLDRKKHILEEIALCEEIPSHTHALMLDADSSEWADGEGGDSCVNKAPLYGILSASGSQFQQGLETHAFMYSGEVLDWTSKENHVDESDVAQVVPYDTALVPGAHYHQSIEEMWMDQVYAVPLDRQDPVQLPWIVEEAVEIGVSTMPTDETSGAAQADTSTAHHWEMVELAKLQAEARALKEATAVSSPAVVDAQARELATSTSCTSRRRRRGRGGSGAASVSRATVSAPKPTVLHEECSEGKLSSACVMESVVAEVASSAENKSSESCAELMHGLEAGDELRAEALSAMRSSVLYLTLEGVGCRVVQFALQVADVTAAVDVIADLRGHVVEAMQSPHGNYVIQKIVETLPVVHSSFIVEELRVMGAGAVARHRYGCRVVCRMLEHCASEEPATTFISEVLSEAGELCRHAFGHHVIHCIMEHALPGQRELIFEALCCELSRNVRNRNANFVIEKAFTCCSAEEQSNFVDRLLSCGEDLLAALAQSRVAPRLGRMLSGLPERRSSDAVEQLQLATGKLHGTKFGKLLLKSFGLGEALGRTSSRLVVAAA